MDARFFVLSVFLCVHVRCECDQPWDPDAGLVASYTDGPGVTVWASSHNDTAGRVLDGDDNTNWVSSYCLPGGYMSSGESNVLLGVCAKGLCTSPDTNVHNIAAVTDGSVYSVANVHVSGGVAKLSIPVPSPTTLMVLSVDGVFHDDNTKLFVYDSHGTQHLVRTFSAQDNYKVIEISTISFNVSRIEIESHQHFDIKQVAALGPGGCVQQIVVDLGAARRIGTIRTRHWAGANAETLYLKTSVDGSTWVNQGTLNPGALRPVTTSITPTTARYIALDYRVNLDQNYRKVYCYEIDAWDEHGRYGPPLPIRPQTQTIREILGVNGIWGWGHSAYSNSLPRGEGPTLYNAVASHARNYHNLGWDVKDPDNDPGFTNMAAGHGTNANWWLNWDTEYTAWKDAGFYVDTSIQFTNKTFPQSVWNTPEQSAYNYGREFALHFSKATGLVDAMEVGNEPWDYDASFYATVLKGMSAGVRSANSSLLVLPGAFQADNKDDTGNYIGTRVLPEVADNIDVINSHAYSFWNNPQGVRQGTYPEHKQSTFNTVRSIVRWRDANTPSKPVWITEWGFDAGGNDEDCHFPECVSEWEQPSYAVRALMILARSGIEKATWYFYANTDCTHLFCRSGLTTSKAHNFTKKPVFHIFEEILSILGDKYFLGALQENDNGYVYAFGGEVIPATSDWATIIQKATHIVGWLPMAYGTQQINVVNVTLPAGTHMGATWSAPQTAPMTLLPGWIQTHGNTVTLGLSSRPVIVEIKRNAGGVVVG